MTIIKPNKSGNQKEKSLIDQVLRDFEMSFDESIIRREGKRLIIEPKKRSDLNNRPESNSLTFLPLGGIRI
ncbi:MAG: hypothetical protein GX846_09480 [Deltaproteobacteria bacterium]|jgi:hypothetical protein|nr:hypothetical protein [Deltaproteobacteria bacterium]